MLIKVLYLKCVCIADSKSLYTLFFFSHQTLGSSLVMPSSLGGTHAQPLSERNQPTIT